MIHRCALVLLLACLACERSASTPAVIAASSSAASSSASSTTTQLSVAQEAPAFPEYQIVTTDSAQGSWSLYFAEAQGGGTVFIGSHVRHPAGLMVIWLDTAVRAAAHPVGLAHADSVLVDGLEHGEYLGRFCAIQDGSSPGEIVGLVPDADSLFRPRLAWKFNPQTFRIERYPTDSIKCRVTDPLEGEAD
jgi:hypothetical protein